jgi:hypothetical protein
MTNNVFIWPFSQSAEAGDRLYFFDTGTTTPKNVYDNAVLSVSLGAELVADSAGLFQECFLSNSAYKIVWNAASGAEKSRLDPYARDTNFSVTGDLDMSARSINNIADGTAAKSAVNKSQLAALSAVSGTFTINGGNLQYRDTNGGSVATQKIAVKVYENSVNDAHVGLDGDAGLGSLNFSAMNGAANLIRAGVIIGNLGVATAGAEKGQIKISVQNSGAGLKQVSVFEQDRIGFFNTDPTYKPVTAGSVTVEPLMITTLVNANHIGFGGGVTSSAVDFIHTNDTSEKIRHAYIEGVVTDDTTGQETGELRFGTKPATGGAVIHGRIDDDGTFIMGASTPTNGTHTITKKLSVQGDALLAVNGDSAPVATAVFQHVTGGGVSGANAALKLQTDSVTGRSLNAGGTINASGADYAEYELKGEGCGAIKAGDIVGKDANGRLTQQYSEAVTFLVKTTKPCIVGGDAWGTGQDKPIKPKSATPAQVTAYEDALTAFNDTMEAERAKYDRMSYCGKVPLNASGSFAVGDFIVPVAGDNDSIAPAFVNPGALSFQQSLQFVGVVVRRLEDGRPEINVNPIAVKVI